MVLVLESLPKPRGVAAPLTLRPCTILLVLIYCGHPQKMRGCYGEVIMTCQHRLIYRLLAITNLHGCYKQVTINAMSLTDTGVSIRPQGVPWLAAASVRAVGVCAVVHTHGHPHTALINICQRGTTSYISVNSRFILGAGQRVREGRRRRRRRRRKAGLA